MRYEFENETAVLAADLRHVLRRVAGTTLVVTFAVFAVAIFDALNGDWIAAGLDVIFAGILFQAGYETWKRQRRYSVPSSTSTEGVAK